MSLKITHIFSGDLWGGAETQALQLLEGLIAEGEDATALIFNSGECHSKFVQAGIPAVVVDESKSGFYAQVLKELKTIKPEIVVSHDYKDAFIACFYACKNKIPWAHIVHGSSESRVGIKAFKSRLYRFLLFGLARFFAANVIVVSNSLAKELGIDSWEKTKIIFNSVAFIETKGKSEKQDTACIVGRLVPVKRVDNAIAAFVAAQEEKRFSTKLLVIGDGPDRKKLEIQAKASSCAQQIEFLGFRDDAVSLIKNSQLLIISSDSEGLPTVLLEAMSSETPVVSTSVGGIPEVFEIFPRYPHRLVQVRSVPALSEGISSLLSSKEKFLEESFQQEFVNIFSQKSSAKSHIELYQLAISSLKRSNWPLN